MGITSWEEYIARVGEAKDYLSYLHAMHISPVDGIGIRLEPGTEAGRMWGDGTGPDTTSRETYKLLLDEAHRRNLPVAVECEYITPRKKIVDYLEADAFLETVLRNYAEDSK